MEFEHNSIRNLWELLEKHKDSLQGLSDLPGLGMIPGMLIKSLMPSMADYFRSLDENEAARKTLVKVVNVLAEAVKSETEEVESGCR